MKWQFKFSKSYKYVDLIQVSFVYLNFSFKNFNMASRSTRQKTPQYITMADLQEAVKQAERRALERDTEMQNRMIQTITNRMVELFERLNELVESIEAVLDVEQPVDEHIIGP